MPNSPYEMTLSLNVLEHLGINLYSNVPSVLSEIVANAWDADAELVSIELSAGDTIVIYDDGIGMTRSDVNDRFLRVGYQRRKEQPAETEKKRKPMGRKGIGKLSLFSIANKVEIHTIKDGEKSALKMNLLDIRKQIQGKKEGTYRPDELDEGVVNFSRGTRIILSDLRKRRTTSTAKALRKKIARRFSIIGAKEKFAVKVDNKKVTPADRDYYSKLQFLWTYGKQPDLIRLSKESLSKAADSRSEVLKGKRIKIDGWIGTVHESRMLKDEESGDNLNRIAIFVRGKMAQEDILDDFGERGVYASYLIGELRVDTLDEDDQEDAATSSRQKIVEDDPRYQELQEVLGHELKYIQNRWSEWRAEEGAKKALEIPEISRWMEGLPAPQRSRAKSWIGKVYRVKTNSEDERKQLLKHSVFAYEFYKANERLEDLESIEDDKLDAALEIFRDLDTLEFSLYGQIVRQRLSIIETLQNKIEENDLEKAIQEYIFDHLWLLDPHWERADTEQFMERQVGKLFADVDAKLSAEEKASRIDIKYRKTAGTHVIIELKRPERRVDLPELTKQIEKYRSGLAKLLEDQGLDEPIEIICLLGKRPSEWNNPGGKKLVAEALKPYGARVILYKEMLRNAYKSYEDYLNQKKTVDGLQDVIRAIEEF